MKPKSAIRVALLIFVVGSVAYMTMNELRGANDVAATQAPSNDAIPAVAGVEPQVIVYFFDEGKDCSTCDKLKGYAVEALKGRFPGELASGLLAWRVLDVDEGENEHYVTDYQLYTKSVVVVGFEDGEQIRWKNLEEVWDLVYDKPAYLEYVESNVREFLGAPS